MHDEGTVMEDYRECDFCPEFVKDEQWMSFPPSFHKQ